MISAQYSGCPHNDTQPRPFSVSLYCFMRTLLKLVAIGTHGSIGGRACSPCFSDNKSQFTHSLCFLQYAVHFNPIHHATQSAASRAEELSSHEPPPTWSQASTEGANHLCCTRVICDITLDSSKRSVHFSVHVRLQLLHLARVTCDTRNKKGALSKCSPHLVPVTGEPIQKNQGEPTSGDDVNVRREKQPHCSQHCGGWATHEKRAREIKPEKNGEENVENAKECDELHFA